jgi:hypothetical protein
MNEHFAELFARYAELEPVYADEPAYAEPAAAPRFKAAWARR